MSHPLQIHILIAEVLNIIYFKRGKKRMWLWYIGLQQPKWQKHCSYNNLPDCKILVDLLMETPRVREALRCVLTFVTNELSACVLSEWLAYYSEVYPFHTHYSDNSIWCTKKIIPKYGSVDTSAAINGVSVGDCWIICLSELQGLCWVPVEEITVWNCHLFCMSVHLPLLSWSRYYVYSVCAEIGSPLDLFLVWFLKT